MAFDWEENIVLDKEIIGLARGNQSPEVYLRASVGRSYYGALGLAKARLIRRGVPAQALNSHMAVPEEYCKDRASTIRQIGHNLRDLYERRRKADYESEAIIDEKEAETASILADDIRRGLDRVPTFY
jgi:uncharacterized protein (UPF0332 family)